MTKLLLASAAICFALATSASATAPATDTLSIIKSTSGQFDLEAKRRKPRVPGGSGCDTPQDVAEHPECRPAAKKASIKAFEIKGLIQEAKRRKPRVPGGSGCDTPQDVAEHPECRPAAKKA